MGIVVADKSHVARPHFQLQQLYGIVIEHMPVLIQREANSDDSHLCSLVYSAS